MRLPFVLRREHLALAAILAVTLLLRVPSLLEPPWYDDEGIYAAVANAMLHGSRLYTDVSDNRPPGMYLLYAALIAVGNADVFAVKLGASAAVLMTQVTLFFLTWRLWNAKTAAVTALVYGFIASLPVVEGNLANAEVFMVLPVSLAMLLATDRRFFSAGLAFGVAFLIKQVAGLEMAACVVSLALFAPQWRRPSAKVIAGFAIPIAVTALVLQLLGGLGDFLFAGFGYYFGYVQRETRIPAAAMVFKAALLAGTVALAWWVGRGPRSHARFACTLPAVWLAFGIFGALFTSRPYPHYLLEALPPLMVLAIPAFTVQWNKPFTLTVGRLASVAAVAVLTSSVFLSIYVPWVRWAAPDKMGAYYENFVGLVSGQRSVQEYNDAFDQRVNRNFTLLRLMQALAKPGDPMLIWGEEPWLYDLANARVAAPYVVSYFAYEMPSGLKNVVDQVKRQHPGLVLWTKNKAMYPELRAELDRDYVEIYTLGNAVLYQRAPSSTNLAASLVPQGAGTDERSATQR